MTIYISPTGNREIWNVRPEGYCTDEEWKVFHPDKMYSVIGTNTVRFVGFPYDYMENEVEMSCLPPDDVSVSTTQGRWIESKELVTVKMLELKNAKLEELNALFENASNRAHCLSSTGFEINADETANRNISSLIIALEASGQETVQFCAYDNSFHTVTLDQLKAMQLEIIANAQALYARKWALRELINEAETNEELDEINIVFEVNDG